MIFENDSQGGHMSILRRLGSMARGWRRGSAAPAEPTALTLRHICLAEEVELLSIDLPLEELEPLLERGILPGCRLCPVRHSPSGDPIIAVDGSLIALRRETAACLCVRRLEAAEA
jgi:Fe2+ transport system protein FeoA